MPYLEDDVTQDKAVERQRRRWAIVGRPEIGKTTSLFTFPRPCAIVSCPDELGFGTIPKHAHEGGVASCLGACPRWQLDTYLFGAVNTEKPDWMGTVEETRRLMADLLTGKKGWRGVLRSDNTGQGGSLTMSNRSAEPQQSDGRTPTGSTLLPSLRYRTVAVDGWHKLYPVYLNMFTGGQYARGEQFDGRKAYPQTNQVFFGDARRWCQTDVEWLIFTMWVERDPDDPNNPAASAHFFPALSGKAGQNVVGEIGITVAAERQGQGPAAKYIWMTQPDAKYWGIGMHLPPDLAKKVPPFVAQDWKSLVPYLGLENT